jgi:hypothetical protein
MDYNPTIKLSIWAMMVAAGLAVAAPTRAQRLVQTDYGSKMDTSSCEPGMLDCDPIGDLADFANQMDTQFKDSASCRGISFIRYPFGPGDLDEKARLLHQPHWFFNTLLYTVGNKSQPWHLLDAVENQVAEGQGTPAEIAATVCTIIRGGGKNQ